MIFDDNTLHYKHSKLLDNSQNKVFRVLEVNRLVAQSQHFTKAIPTTGVLVMYVNKGQGTIAVDKAYYGMKQHDVLVSNLEQELFITSHEWDITCIHVDGNLCSTFCVGVSLFSLHDDMMFPTFLERVVTAVNHNQPLLAISIMASFLNECQTNPRNAHTVRSKRTPIQRSLDFIEAEFAQPLSIADIAKQANFSKYHFIRLFKREIGVTPYQYLLQTRLRHASFLLVYTDDKVRDIAHGCGFPQEQNFIQAFRQMYYTSPRQFRMQRGVINE